VGLGGLGAGVGRGVGGGGRKARGIYAASMCEVRVSLEGVDALGRRTMKRRERRGPGGGGA